MRHEEQRMYLIKELLAEEMRYREFKIPSDEQGQKDLLRGLMNVRPPRTVSRKFLEIQDEYLTAERDMGELIDAKLLPSLPSDPRIALWRGDITTLKADAIVNAANSALLGCFRPLHSCIDNIIHSKSGIQLRLFCNDIMKKQGYEEAAGGAKITPGFNLPAKYVLHTVGPVIYGRVTEKECGQLASCYRSCLKLAVENGCKTIAFCCISTGEFHFPNRRAAEIAIGTVKDFLSVDKELERVIFNVFKEKDLEIYEELFSESGLFGSSIYLENTV